MVFSTSDINRIPLPTSRKFASILPSGTAFVIPIRRAFVFHGFGGFGLDAYQKTEAAAMH